MSIYRFICLLISFCLFIPIHAKKEEEVREKAPIFGGAALYVDLVGPIMKAFGTSGANMEVGARLNFKEKFFPVFEMGLGSSSRDGAENDNHFECNAPFFRVGMDYNINKKINGNRFFAGGRYGFSSFNFDFTNTTMVDPVWGTHSPLLVESQRANYHWLEIVVGMETKLWRIVRLGYTVRVKFVLADSGILYGEPYYIPGFGRNGQPFGGTFYLAFDIGKSAKKKASVTSNGTN